MEFKLVRASGSKGLGDLLKAKNATINDFTGRDAVTDPLTDLLRKGARDLLQAATDCMLKDREELLTFYDFPAQHWQSIRTSNPIESAFATIRHRTKRTKGCFSRDGMLHIPLIVLLHKTTAGQWMFKVGQCAEKSWRNLRGFANLADIIQGVDFINGIKPSNEDQAAA